MAEIAHSGRIIGVDHADCPGPAAAQQAQEDPQVVETEQGLENLWKGFNFFGFIVDMFGILTTRKFLLCIFQKSFTSDHLKYLF